MDEKDRIIRMKKPGKERSNSDAIPNLNFEKSLELIRYYYANQISCEDKTLEKYFKPLSKCLNKKINSYKQQDILKKKYNRENFINEEEVVEKLLVSKLSCYYCKNPMVLFYTLCRQPDQWTLERLDNNIGHSCENTVVACLKCNLQRRDKNSGAFKFAKQLVIKKV